MARNIIFKYSNKIWRSFFLFSVGLHSYDWPYLVFFRISRLVCLELGRSRCHFQSRLQSVSAKSRRRLLGALLRKNGV